MSAMNATGMYATGVAARMRAFVASPFALPVVASWHHVCIDLDGKTGTGTRRLGELSP